MKLQSHVRSKEIGFCWYSYPNVIWSLGWYVRTIRGAESFHIYLWIMKDMAWSCDWYVAGHFFGISAVIWSFCLLVCAISWRNFIEVIVSIAQLMWLIANVWWMTGELHDSKFPLESPIYDSRMEQAGIVLRAALVWLASYYILLKPFNWSIFRPSPASEAEYNDTGLESKYHKFGFYTWRELENLHLFFWLAKDTAWNGLILPMWIVFAIPTVLLALDFCVVTLFYQGLVIENAHMTAQLVWVTANLLWAWGELYSTDSDEASELLAPVDGGNGNPTLRWWSAMLLFLSFIPIIALHVHWLLCTREGLVHRRRAMGVDTAIAS